MYNIVPTPWVTHEIFTENHRLIPTKPPNGMWDGWPSDMMSLEFLSSASEQNLFVMASTQIMSLFFCKSFDKYILGIILLHVEVSSICKGMLNLKCAVLPPGSNKEANPLEATGKTISSLPRNFVHKVFQINVFRCLHIHIRRKNHPLPYLHNR